MVSKMRKVYIVINGMDYEASNPERVFTSRKKAISYIEKTHPDFQYWKDKYDKK